MNEQKKKIIARLVEAGNITFYEAMLLMETETVTKTEKIIVKEVVREIAPKENPFYPRFPKYEPIPYWMQPGFKGHTITC